MANRKNTPPLSFEPFDGDDEAGFEVVDPIDRHRYTLRTPVPATLSSADSSQFLFPVDAAGSVQTSSIILPEVALTHVRDDEGEVLATTEEWATEDFDDGTYIIELQTPIKLYLRVESPLTVIADFERTTIEFGEMTTVAVGARSYHHRPAVTVTTTPAPEDVMEAVSTFGSALKTTNPERAYPTLRGHPPTIEIGNELTIPDHLKPSQTAITVEIPADFHHIYPAAPLAYYLDAELVPGDEPRLHVGSDFIHELDTDRGYENEIVRVLKQTFFLDCLTRTEGLYDAGGDLHERKVVETDTELAGDLDFAALYTASPSDRLASYLDVPFPHLEPYLPNWKLTAHMQPTPASVETLPFVVNELAVVRTPGPDDVATVSPMEASEFDEIRGTSTANSAGAGADADANGRFTRGSRDDSSENASTDGNALPDDGLYVQLPVTGSHEQAWVGDGAPVNASKTMKEAYRNRLNRPSNHGDIAVTVVCNDVGMSEERETVNEIYGSDATLPFNVTVHSDLTCSELRGLLATSTEFLHYIGHVDSDGFACADSTLDARTLSEVNVDAFLLNSCHSYQQGEALVRKGAIGGIVTLNEVMDYGALEMGKTLARLLHTGFPLRPALEIARENSLVGKQYLVIGDGGLAVGQSDSGCPGLCDIERTADGYRIDYRHYPTEERGMGSIVTLYLPSASDYYFVSGGPHTFEVSQEDLAQFLSLEDIPVGVNGTLHWSDEIEIGEI